MNSLRLAALAAILISGAVLADDTDPQIEHKTKIQVVVAGDGRQAPTEINWTSSASGIDLNALQIGESQSIVADDGRSILVTKQEDGLRFDVDGESVVVPDIGNVNDIHGGPHVTNMAFVSADGVTEFDHDVDVTFVADGLAEGHAMASAGGTMIMTKEPLDQATQDSIKSLLQSSGNNDEVTFIDSGTAGGRQLHVVKKTVEVSN